MATDALNRAINALTEADLRGMVLEADELPDELSGYVVLRESVLDNETMADQGFPTATAERFREAGRITGYVREFGPSREGGLNVLVGTVAHLFTSQEAVSGWMHNIFLKEFEDNVGHDIGGGHQLISVERLEPSGFYDEAVAIKALQSSPTGLLSSTVIDFRVGRILGVAFGGSVGDYNHLEIATQAGIALETRIVRVALGTI